MGKIVNKKLPLSLLGGYLVVSAGVIYGLEFNDSTIEDNIRESIVGMANTLETNDMHDRWINFYNDMIMEKDNEWNYIPFRAVIMDTLELGVYKRPQYLGIEV